MLAIAKGAACHSNQSILSESAQAHVTLTFPSFLATFCASSLALVRRFAAGSLSSSSSLILQIKTHGITAIPVWEGSEAASCPPVPAPTSRATKQHSGSSFGLQQGPKAMPALPIQDTKVACVVDKGKTQRNAALSAEHEKVKHVQVYQAPLWWKRQSISSKREVPSREVHPKMLPAWSWKHNLNSAMCPLWQKQH